MAIGIAIGKIEKMFKLGCAIKGHANRATPEHGQNLGAGLQMERGFCQYWLTSQKGWRQLSSKVFRPLVVPVILRQQSD